MEKNSTKSLKWLSAVVIFLCILNAVHAVVQGIGCMVSPEEYGAVWFDDAKVLQIMILTGRMLGGIMLSLLMTAFIFNSLKSLKNGILFPWCNVGILYASAVSYFVYTFCNSNIVIVAGVERNILLNADDLMVSLIIVIFAVIYKVAVKVSMENSLTI